MNIRSYILFILVTGLINSVNSYPAGNFNTVQSGESDIFGYQHSSSSKIESSDNTFDLTALRNYFTGSDQNDDYTLYHNKTMLLNVLLTGRNKLFTLRKKEFLPIQSSSYFELDIPPPLLDA